ncbi:MAG: sodium-dependent transporter [Gammaproteobacteria bacterium]|nr:sodium-dependent transporter [Gammaproteobacteria bacterium]
MEQQRSSIHGQWSGRLAFILAATGSAVGLGNIWKFPYITGENGGGAFVLVYLLCIALVGIPIMMAEVMLGRRGRQSPINTMMSLAKEEGAHRFWKALGWMGVLAGFLILSYYSVIAGWALSYVSMSLEGAFVGASAEGIGALFSNLIADPQRLILWHSLFMLMTIVVVARGVRGGLEVAVRYLMPGLGLLLLVMLGYAISSGYFMQGLAFLFDADFSKINSTSILVAMGHAFFTLSLGMGAIMVYGSYLPKGISIAKTSVLVALADTVVALLAGMVIFPLVFANGLEPGAGPGLIFQTLPIAFGQMSGGLVFGTLFFVLLVFAAWSSAISLIEPAVAYLVENRGMKRLTAALICGLATWLVGLATVFSFNIWSDVTLFDKTIFDLLDFVTSNIMLPLGGLMIAIFAVWVMKKESSRQELAMNVFGFSLWYWVTRLVTPVAVLLVFLNSIGFL